MNALIKEVRDTAGSYALDEMAAVGESVPTGYQRTEVGVIPEDWATSTVGAALDRFVVRKDIKNLHLGVYPPDGRVRVAAPLSACWICSRARTAVPSSARRSCGAGIAPSCVRSCSHW
jgi:hypothetical protein